MNTLTTTTSVTLATATVTSSVTLRNFQEIDMYRGQDILDQWNFFSAVDPTHGSVNYQTREDAIAKGLAVVDPMTNVVTLSVDDFSTLAEGAFRDSVRISTPKRYTGGLFIADFVAMPYGCSTWPAYWSIGVTLATDGEIDIIENTHNAKTNYQTLHSGPDCTMAKNSEMTGILGNTNCAIAPWGNSSGCAVRDWDTTAYGAGFNAAGGGVMAHLWDNTGIKIWHFSRSKVPDDITNGTPHPEMWGKPVSNFRNDTCDIGSHFENHALVINTSLCGEWAGGNYQYSGCPGTCSTAVMDPTNYANAKWKINYVAVYN
ncbi:concanavalin A-like lectin/glucanase domain-containing protein [Mycena floridula]|nr:concanavalin A-like lectin/glucanase domain-containing protein [Mycena floridula]